MRTTEYALLAFILGLLAMLLPLSVDGFVALVPSLAKYYSVSSGSVQLCISSVILGIAVGQTIHGPLSDGLGRKPVLIGGVSCYVIVSLMCMYAFQIEILIVLRFFQGLFACSGIIVARAIIRDLFDREAGARLFATMMGIHGLMPILIPGVSGWLVTVHGWSAMFLIMSIFGGVVLVIVGFKLPETIQNKNKEAIQLRLLTENYAAVLRNSQFRSYAICSAFMYGALMAYFAGAPIGLIQFLNLAPEEFGIAMASPMIAYVFSQLLVARMAIVLGVIRLIKIGVCIGFLGGLCMPVLFLLFGISVYSIICPVIIILISLAFVVPGANAGAMSPFASNAGAASSVLGFIQFSLAAIAAAIVGISNNGTPWPMATLIFICTACAILTFFFLVRVASRNSEGKEKA